MNDIYESIIFYDELPPEQQEALRDEIARDPEYARAYRQWMAVRYTVRQRMEDALPDRSLLVLYALSESGMAESLTDEERHALDAGRGEVEHAISTIPALAYIVERIQEEQADFEAAWASYDGAASSTSETTTKLNASAETKAQAARIDRQPRRPETQRSPAARWPKRLAIAVVALGFAVVTLLLIQGEPSNTVVEVAEGETRVVELADGSTVRMVGFGRLEYTAAETAEEFSRRATLTAGDAFFDIASSPRAFVVETPTSETVVTGTQFSLQTTELETKIILAEGEVAFRARGAIDEQGVVLQPSQMSSVRAGEEPLPPRTVNLAEALDWTGLIIFRDTPLNLIAVRLAEHFSVDILVDPALSGERVTGTFENDQPVREILEALAATLNARVEGGAAEGFTLAPASSQE